MIVASDSSVRRRRSQPSADLPGRRASRAGAVSSHARWTHRAQAAVTQQHLRARIMHPRGRCLASARPRLHLHRLPVCQSSTCFSPCISVSSIQTSGQRHILSMHYFCVLPRQATTRLGLLTSLICPSERPHTFSLLQAESGDDLVGLPAVLVRGKTTPKEEPATTSHD